MSTAEAYETIELGASEGVARISLNRPDSLNSWNTRLGEELLAAVEAVAADPEARAVLITGAGRAFSSGADLRSERQLTERGTPDVTTNLTRLYHPIIAAVRGMPKPVVAAVNGPAVGVGCSLALACDLILAAESAYFLLAFARLGLTLDGGASATLPARIGHARAAELAMLAERLDAPTAFDWGLVNRVVADDELVAEAEALAARLAAGPTASYAATKRLLNQRLYAGFDEQLALEIELQQERADSPDFVEGVLSFIEKREPNFRGV